VGSPTGREPYGDTVPVVVAGVTTCQGGREGRLQGEGAQVIGHRPDQGVCEMQSAETVLGVLREPGQPAWATAMARKGRKTLVVCGPCHGVIHHGPATIAA
jgi:hypothetical protein